MAFAVIAAAGLGERMGGGAPKFEAELAGRPLVVYSLEAMQAASSVDSIALVVPADRVADWRVSPHLERISKLTSIVAGGESRRDSVWNGMQAAPGVPEVVVVHDAARPLVTPALVDRACLIPEGFDGTVAAVPLTDTVKEVEGEVIVATPDRGRLVAVQTPQAFRFACLKRAHEQAAREGFVGTDDAALVERAGGRVAVIEGSRDNIKVTFPEDLERARAILERRG